MPRSRLPLALVFLLIAVSCTSALTGNEGNLRFSYIADDDVADFNKPIAPGASLDLEVRAVGTNRQVTVDSVIVDDRLFEVMDIRGSGFTLRALEEGNGLIEVEALASDGTLVFDSVNMLAREPEVLQLSHTCTSDRLGTYLTNQRILVPFDMERRNGQAVIGYGRYPVTLPGSALLTLDPTVKAQAFLHLDTGSVPGSTTIQSTLDDTFLDVDVVRPDEIDGAEIFFDGLIETDVGDTDPYFVVPTVRGRRICQADLNKTVRSETPEVCRAADRVVTGEGSERGSLTVTGLAAGVCRVAVTYTDAGMGGFTAFVELEIAP